MTEMLATLAPLFSLPLARLRITCELNGDNDEAFCSRLRGVLGLELKRKCCGFKDFRIRSCPECDIAASCGYVGLFSPLPPPPEIDRNGRLRTWPPPPRPFALSSDWMDKKNLLFGVELTLMGPALQNADFFLDTLVQGLGQMRRGSTEIVRQVLGVDAFTPSWFTGRYEEQDGFMLGDWLTSCNDALLSEDSRYRVAIQCLSPLCLTGNRKKGQESFPELLVKAVIRRLRDLKRAYGLDTHMGKLQNRLFARLTEARCVDNRLRPCSGRRYSYRQHRNINLASLCGQAVYDNIPAAVLPLLEAAQIIQAGKGTSWGLGRIELQFQSSPV